MLSAPLTAGTLLHNRYCILGVAGEQRGRTYLARDRLRAGTLCILKEFALPPQRPQTLEQLQKQFQTLNSRLHQLQHPQLPRYQVLFLEGDRGYWVREYIEGKDYQTLLRERVAAGQSFSETDVLHLLEQVMPVLDYLHQKGMIHRDICLENLIRRDRDHLPVLINYGLVKELVTQLQKTPIDFQPSPADPSFDHGALARLTVSLLAGLESTNWAPIAEQVAADPAFTRLLPPQYFHALAPQSRSRQATRRATQPSRLEPKRLSSHQFGPQVQRRSGDRHEALSSAALVISLILLVVAAAFRLTQSLPPRLELPPTVNSPHPPTAPPTEPSPRSTLLPVPTPPPPPQGVGGDEPGQLQSFHRAAPEALRDRWRQLGVDFSFFTRLVDETFYAKYPELKQRQLGQGAEPEKYRSDWNTIALALMDKLQQIPPEMRGKLGTYQRPHYDQWLKSIGEANQQKLDDRTDRRFLELFPDRQGKPQNPRTYGQLWYAIAYEQSQRQPFLP
jgi:serine/threonine protein kinase, bacterial